MRMPFAASSMGLSFHAWVVALAAVLVAVAMFAYWRATPEPTPRSRWILSAARAGALLVLALLLMDPRSIWRGERVEAPQVVLLVDRSQSMSLPAQGWSGGESRFDAATRAASDAAHLIEARGGRAQTVYFAKGADFDAVDDARPDGQGTDVGAALDDVARRYEGEHLSAVVVVSDGADTDAALVRRAPPDVPVWTIGTGDTLAPDDVRIATVEYNPIVRAPSRAIVDATIASTGPHAKRVHVELTEGGRTVFRADTTLVGGAADVRFRAGVQVTEPGRREFVLSVSSDGTDAEAENNRRDVVIEVEKARTRIVIVDLTPTWELAFLTSLIADDPAYDCEVVVSGQRPAAPIGRLKRPDEFVASLAEADAVVLASVDDALMTDAAAAAVRRFVEDRGGGLLVLPGPRSLYETAAAWGRLADLLPLKGTPPFSFALQYTAVGPSARAAASPITAPLIPLLSQTEWQERAPLLGFYSGLAPTAAGEVLLGVRGRPAPALVHASVGKGRVTMVCAGPLWRWKFVAESNGVYDELMERVIDVLTRGEESGRFVLVADKNVFEAGESPVLHAEILNERLQPVSGVPVRVEVARIDSSGAQTPLAQATMRREAPDASRLTAQLDPLPAGRYAVRGVADLPDQTIESRPLEFRVSTTSVEFQRTLQDRDALVRIARRTGGEYTTPDGARAAMERLPLTPRRVPAVSESVLRAATPLFVIVLLLLSLEWLLRKRTGMI
jgi:hypothetical protein